MTSRLSLLMAAALAACDGAAPAAADAGAGGCDYQGVHHAGGELFGAGDGCNVCMCSELGAECTLRACDACAGPRPALADCFASRGYADCGEGAGGPGPGPLACGPGGDCRWFAAYCLADGYLPSLCPDEDLCCADGFPLADWQLPVDQREGYSWWLYGNGTLRWTRERAMTVDVTIDPALADAGTAFSCSGAPGDGDTPCSAPTAATGRVGDVVELTLGRPASLFGWQLVVEIDAGLDGGPRARACQYRTTDVAYDRCDSGVDVQCASGTLALDRLPTADGELPGLRGAIDVTFDSGLRLSGTFTL